MPNCTILIGPPGVGKTTWMKANQRLSDWYISTDAIIEDIANEYEMTYDEAFPKLIKFAEDVMWREIDRACDDDYYDIVIDRTNMSAGARGKFINYLKDRGYTFTAVVFEVPEKEEWERRLNRPGKTIPQNVIESMVRNFQFPTFEEGFAAIGVVDAATGEYEHSC